MKTEYQHINQYRLDDRIYRLDKKLTYTVLSIKDDAVMAHSDNNNYVTCFYAVDGIMIGLKNLSYEERVESLKGIFDV